MSKRAVIVLSVSLSAALLFAPVSGRDSTAARQVSTRSILASELAPSKPSGARGSNARTPPLLQNADQRRLSHEVTIKTDLVNVDVSVTDSRGRFVPGLTKEQFEVFDDKVRQDIAHFSDEDVPITIGILFDISGSMREHIVRAQKALEQFTRTLHGDDDFFLITFNKQANLAQDFTTSSEDVLERLKSIVPKGETALYNAAYIGVRKAEEGRHSRKAILIVSDGQDNDGRSFKKLRDEIEEAAVQIYAIGINDYVGNYGRPLLTSLTERTGGRAFFPKTNEESELLEACTRIALELRHQYSIGFYPTDNARNVGKHKIQVRLNAPKAAGRLSVNYKGSYVSFEK